MARAAGTALIDRGAASELGHEPPIFAGGEEEPLDRRHVNLRWLAGTILAGLSGALLIGSAIYVSLDGELTFAERAQPAISAQTRLSGEAERSEHRGARILPPVEVVLAKQAFRTPTTIRVGDREVIRVKPFVRVATNLAQSSLGFSGDIPSFNPMKLYSSGGGPVDKAAPEPEPQEGDADVSVQRHPLTEVDFDTVFDLREEQIAAQVEEERRRSREALPMPSQLLLSRTLPAPSFPAEPGLSGPSDTEFSSIQITVVPENVQTIEKIPAPPEGSPPIVGGNVERTVTVRKGETLDQILRANGVGLEEVPKLLAALGRKLKEGPVKEGQKLRLLVGHGPDPRVDRQLLRLMIVEDERVTAIAAIDDQNQFVPVAPPPVEQTAVAEATPTEDDEGGDDNGAGLRLYDSLYETALKNEVPPTIIEQIVKIFFYDVDLQRRVANGDGIEIFYGEDEEADGRPELLFASLTVGGTTRHYYRYVNPDDGGIDYFDDQGKSNRKFLIRKPIAEGVLRSGFGMRYHPILRYSKMHTGIDWANKIGTPIFAAGDGVVQSAGWHSGYGRHIEIEHPYNFTTTYSHMSGFAKGIKEGIRVRQGQVIGYVGTTGLSTGPHLHYEVLVNDNFVDPLSIKLPRNRELDGKQVADFKRERERIDELMRKAPQATKVAGRS